MRESNEQLTLLEESQDRAPYHGEQRILLPNTAAAVRLLTELRCGQVVLLDRGTVQMVVKKRLGITSVHCEVKLAGSVADKIDLAAPEAQLLLVDDWEDPLTEKDRADIAAVMALDGAADFFTCPMISTVASLECLHQALAQHTNGKTSTQVLCKVDTPLAYSNVDALLDGCAGLIVSRGSLGVNLGLERVPFAQKMLVRRAISKGKVAMTRIVVESMSWGHLPNSAEVSDVANAVFDGADVLVLGRSTATGVDPARVIKVVSSIVQEAERNYTNYDLL